MYAKVIGPNIFKTPRTVRLKIILQLLNYFAATMRQPVRAAAAHNHTPHLTRPPRRHRCAAALQRPV
jgi:hypothetical protein